MFGIVLTFAPAAQYAFDEHQPRFWRLSAGDDHAVAGLVMALEPSIVIRIALAALFVRAPAESDRDDGRAEQFVRVVT